MCHCHRVDDFRQNMCAFLSRPHQANPHLFERRKLCRPPQHTLHNISSTTGVRAGRPSSYTFGSVRKFPQQLPSKTFLTGFSCLSERELLNPSLSNFVARSLENWGFDVLHAESLVTLSASNISLQSTEISTLHIFLLDILKDVTAVEALSFTFVATVLGIMGAYIVHQVKDHGEKPSLDRQYPRVENSPSTLRNYGEPDAAYVWMNLSSPSPFFRSVCARCPSLSSSTTYQYVQKPRFKKPEYQRQCLPTPDGGTVALDWPLHLDIFGSRELENIVLLISGTVEGSHEDGIVKFSQLLEQHGYFPLVFNPRGCGGSPLTTPRVFSAADSDDVRLAVQFIVKSRPRATILSVGWGLGANILAKYLGEEGPYTPLTAAVCIDNPFDLSACTRSISGSRWLDFDHALSKGLVQILDSNKMIFQGEKKGFDVTGALAATSVRDFDRAISRVAHGCKTLEDFYANTSSGATLDRVQIPLLCIQHLEDHTRTQSYIPHHAFERNVYTMLLLSRPSNSRDDHPGGASEWTHAISLEWLAAVEISILKGQHPLLSEFSPSIKLPRELSTVGNQFSDASSEAMDQSVAAAVPGSASGNSYHKQVAVEEADTKTERTRAASNSHFQAREQKEEPMGRSAAPSKASDGDGAKASESSVDFEEGQQTVDSAKASESSADFEEGQQAGEQLAGEGLTEAEEAERGQVVQLAETVMNVLDVTMPGTLVDAQKQQVLKAVGRGETLVTALEEAVPEDVRGKMSTAVTEVVQAQGLGLKIAGSQTAAPNIPEGITDRIQGRLAELTGKKEAPKSDLDLSSRSGNESSDDKGSGTTAQRDDPTKQITLGNLDQSSKKEKLSSSDETKDLEKGKVATKREENFDPSRKGQVSSKDPKDSIQQLDSENQSDGDKKGSGNASSTGSPNLENQTHDRGNQGKDKQEQPRGSTDNLEERKETNSGGSSEVTSNSDNPSDKLDDCKPGVRQRLSIEEKDNTKDMKGQVDSEEVRGGTVIVESATESKNGESKRDVTTPPSTNYRETPQSGVLSPKTEVPADNSKSPASGSQACDPRSAVVPPDSSNSPPLTSEGSQSPPIPADAANSPPSSSQASQLDRRDIETSAPPSPPPENSEPAPANPPPQNPPVPLPSVGEALQALTGFDDSTQMAVTNVFGVVENVIDQLEKESPSTNANTLRKMSAENMLNQATTEMTKKHEPNAPDPKKSGDEDVNVRGTNDEQSTEVTLSPDYLQKESHLQSFVERKQEMNQPNPTNSLVEVELADPGNGSSRMTASSRGVKPCLSKNERGYIKDAFGQQIESESHEIQDNRQNTESTVHLSENSSNTVQESPAQETVNDGFPAESVNDKRLRVMAAEIDAEGEQPAESLASDQVAADNSVTGVKKDDSSMVADLVMNALKLEVVRRLGSAGLEALGVDLENEVTIVAHAVSEVVTMGKNKLLGEVNHELKGTQETDTNLGGKLGVLNGNSIVTALGSVLGTNSLLGKLLPFGVLAGVVMAALGAAYLIVSDDQEEESAQIKRTNSQIKPDTKPSSARRAGLTSANYREESDDEASEVLADVPDGLGQDGSDHAKHNISLEEGEELSEVDGVNGSASTGCRDGEGKSTEQTAESKPPHQGKFMGAMAAAMGATAAVASTATSTSEGQSDDSKGNESGEQNLVPAFTEKAISMVSPVVPRTAAGELDHERVVAVLTEVGQRGGPLTLIGKVALLWGGLRGAMSLADRLLAFFRIKERPLLQRLLGFGGMSLLLWTPVLVPLLPTLLQQWATKAPSGVADAAAGIGLYGAVFILVTIWGRQVRGYDRPLVSYGLQSFSRAKLRLFAGGLAIGLGLVSGYYAINWLLGYSQFAWDAVVVTNPNFPGQLVSSILTSWKVLMLVAQSLTMAAAVALVEEVLFRAWLQEEIAVDLGYHWAVVISALAFALAHWSPTAMVGLWFLAVALAGARARTDGDLSFPIGIHAGIVTAFSVMNMGGLVRYIPDAPTWITGAYAGNPLAGALGTGMVAALAIALYPRQQERLPNDK